MSPRRKNKRSKPAPGSKVSSFQVLNPHRTWYKERRGVRRVKAQLKEMIGEMKTADEVKAISHFLTELLCTERDNFKYIAWREYHAKLPDEGSAGWHNIIMYRVIGKTASFFVDEDEVNEWADRTLDELEVITTGWMRMAFEGRLSELENPEDDDSVLEEDMGPVGGRTDAAAIRLKMHMETFKKQHGFEKWTYDSMKELRYEIFRALYKDVSERRTYRVNTGEQHRKRARLSSEGSSSISSQEERRGRDVFNPRRPALAAFALPQFMNPQSVQQNEGPISRDDRISINTFTNAPRDQARQALKERLPHAITTSDEDDDEEDAGPSEPNMSQFKHQLEKQKRLYKLSKDKLEAADEEWLEAKTVADVARHNFRNFDNDALYQVSQILSRNRHEGDELNIESVPVLAEDLQRFGVEKAEEILTLMEPLTKERDALEKKDELEAAHYALSQKMRGR